MKLASLLLFVCLLLPFSAVQAETMPKPGIRDSCPVCGMFVHLYPEWLAVVSYKDGTCHFFDGVKDLFKYLYDMEKWATGRNTSAIEKIVVSDYYSLSGIDARKAFYVIGSDLLGPMGHELIPFAVKEDAEVFYKDHKGTQIVSFMMVDKQLLQNLDKGNFK